MATFRIGQRVKIVRDPAPEDMPPYELRTKHDGCNEGLLVRALDYIEVIFGASGDWVMRLDSGVEGSVYEYQIEPLQPERNRIVAWESVPGGKPNVAEPCLRMAGELVMREAA